jgi:hypothetical protein
MYGHARSSTIPTPEPRVSLSRDMDFVVVHCEERHCDGPIFHRNKNCVFSSVNVVFQKDYINLYISLYKFIQGTSTVF